MPSLSGPGSISVAIATSAQIPNDKIVLANAIRIIGIALAYDLHRMAGPPRFDALQPTFSSRC